MFIYLVMAVLERARARLQHAAVGDDGAGARAHRRAVHVHRAVDRRVLGTADVGHVLGVGRAHDLRADAAVPVLRLHRAAPTRSTTRAAPTARARCWRWSASSTCRSSISRCSWWNTLHQGSSVSFTAAPTMATIDAGGDAADDVRRLVVLRSPSRWRACARSSSSARRRARVACGKPVAARRGAATASTCGCRTASSALAIAVELVGAACSALRRARAARARRRGAAHEAATSARFAGSPPASPRSASPTALVLNAFQSNLVFFFTPTQVAAQRGAAGPRRSASAAWSRRAASSATRTR